MSATTNIEWCDSTFNPWIGCTRVSPACDDCYAARSTPARTMGVAWGAGEGRQRTSAANWKLPRRWNAKRFMQCNGCGWRGECAAELIGCGACGSTDQLQDVRRRVFCASLADVFDNAVPVQWRRDLFDLIEATPHLDWLLLTKRIGNARRLYANAYLDSARPWPANVWLGATVCNQDEADRDIPKLLDTPAAKRFLSIEPMLGHIELMHALWKCCGATIPGHGGDGWMQPPDPPECCGCPEERGQLHWVICGGESGPKARPMHPDWARSLRDQCAAAGVLFLFKQWGEFAPITITWQEFLHPAPAHIGEKVALAGGVFGGFPDAEQLTVMRRVGKKAAGRLLDGRTHDEFPQGCAA